MPGAAVRSSGTKFHEALTLTVLLAVTPMFGGGSACAVEPPPVLIPWPASLEVNPGATLTAGKKFFDKRRLLLFEKASAAQGQLVA